MGESLIKEALIKCVFGAVMTMYIAIIIRMYDPELMYVVQMLANVGEKAEMLKYATFFTLFNPDGILEGTTSAMAGMGVLLAGAVILFGAGVGVFCKKDLHI